MDELADLRVMSLEQVGVRLGLSRGRVHIIERVALQKVQYALALEAALGGRAHAVLASLRGKPLRYYEQALRAAGGLEPVDEPPLAAE